MGKYILLIIFLIGWPVSGILNIVQAAGADGDITSVSISSDYNMEFTANAIFYHDNTQTQKVGVRIDEPVRYTDEDIIQKKDLEFERVLKGIR